jgi:hypothetical protein
MGHCTQQLTTNKTVCRRQKAYSFTTVFQERRGIGQVFHSKPRIARIQQIFRPRRM